MLTLDLAVEAGLRFATQMLPLWVSVAYGYSKTSGLIMVLIFWFHSRVWATIAWEDRNYWNDNKFKSNILRSTDKFKTEDGVGTRIFPVNPRHDTSKFLSQHMYDRGSIRKNLWEKYKRAKIGVLSDNYTGDCHHITTDLI